MTSNKILSLLGLVIVTGCSSIGDGNGPVSMELQVNGVAEDAEVFACQVSRPAVRVSFTNESEADFFGQGRDIRYSSSNPDVLAVSDGTYPSPGGQFFRPGVLIPIKAGSATVTANYLDLEDSIDITVSPSSVGIEPQLQTLIQGQSVRPSATIVLDGRERLATSDITLLGDWRVIGEEEGASASEIILSRNITGQLASVVLNALDGAEGVDTVEFAIDFCDLREQIQVKILNQTLEAVRVASADDPSADLESIEVPPNGSFRLRVFGQFSGGFEQDLTGRAGIVISGEEVGFVNSASSGQVTGFDGAAGLSAELTATLDPDSSVEGDEIESSAIPFKVLDVAFVTDSLDISPKNALMLTGTSLQYSAMAKFNGNDGEFDWDVSNGVLWSSDDTEIAAVQNAIGAVGLAINLGDAIGAVQVGATMRRYGADESVFTDSLKEVDLVVGAVEEDDPLAVVQAINIATDDAEFVQGETYRLRVVADIGPEDQVLDSQDISSGVSWSSSDPSLAAVSNAASSRGLVSVLTAEADQTVTITARYFDSNRQEGRFSAQLQIVLNPSPPEPEPAEEQAGT